jgi:hypothetical protein
MSHQFLSNICTALMKQRGSSCQKILNSPLLKYSHLRKTSLKRRRLGLVLLRVGSSTLTVETALQFHATFLT